MKRYWTGVGIGATLFSGFLVWHKQLFSNEKLMTMIEAPTKLKGLTNDYCKYRTSLDPKEPNEQAVRIIFKCTDKEALNIISWSTVTDQTVGGLVNQVKRIHGYNDRKLSCKVDGQPAGDNFRLTPGNLIICE